LVVAGRRPACRRCVRSPTWQPMLDDREAEKERLDQSHPDVLDVEPLTTLFQ
jgi:hypothetical protein